MADPGAKKCNCEGTELGSPTCASTTNPVPCKSQFGPNRTYKTGTYIGACQGIDDVVTVQVGMTLTASDGVRNVGLYINTNGGSGEY